MNRLLTTVVVGLAGIQGIPLAAESRPKMVVGIMVDQLRTDYLESLRDMFGTGGFRRLMDNGVYLKDVDFNVEAGDPASATAIVQTGVYPRQNAITGEFVYDPAAKTIKHIFYDPSFIGNFTTETYSPAALRVTTISDEITVENEGDTRIHSIAPDAAQAIILAGHTGNSAFWVNDDTGKWSSTTYFSNPPATLQNRNYNTPLVSRLDTMKWTPLRKGEPYPYVSPQDIKEGFKYQFSRSDRDVYSQYKLSPYLNSDITSAATEYITELGLGRKAEGTDVLNIAYTLAPFPDSSDSDYRYRLEDAYLRLDKNLEQLFNVLDREVGKDNMLVYLVSTGYFAEPATDNQKYRLPGGTFSVKRAMSLLNAYLSAKYGNGGYIDQYAANQLYLSKNLIEEKNLDAGKLAQEARDFLVKMSGVADAFTLADLMSPSSKETEEFRRAVDPKLAGDIILKFNPGWTVVDDSRYPPVTQENKSSIYQFPGFILGNDIARNIIEEPVDATAIAPTIARTLRIRAPNSASSKAIIINQER